jgi:hypothetical protein
MVWIVGITAEPSSQKHDRHSDRYSRRTDCGHCVRLYVGMPLGVWAAIHLRSLLLLITPDAD